MTAEGCDAGEERSANERSGAFVHNGITLLSGIEPVRRCEKIAGTVSIMNKTLYYCPSPLFCYGLGTFLSRLEKEAPGSAVLCVEADDELYDLTLKNIDPDLGANKKLRIVKLPTSINDHLTERLCSFVRNEWGTRAFRRIETIRWTGGWQLFRELYDSLFEALKRDIAIEWGNIMTLTKLGRLYIRNALRNFSLISRFHSIGSLSFGDAPVLVLGAGPSLDETLNALEQRYPQMLNSGENRSFRIVCADTCLGALKDRNIAVDLAVILESQHWNMRDFIGCKGWEVDFAFDFSALPQSAQMLSGRGFLFMTPWTQLRIFERLKTAGLLPAVIPPLGSVGLTAVELARRAGSGKIICAGIDFSFTADKYHVRSAPGHRSLLDTQTRLRGTADTAAFGGASFAAVSKSGAGVYSNPVMRNYRDLFEREFGGDQRLFDICGSGLPLGVKTLSLHEAMDLLGENLSAHAGIVEESAANKEDYALLKEKLLSFINAEKERLIELKNILTGQAHPEHRQLDVLISECDYLWTHFPDYAGGGKPDLSLNGEKEPAAKAALSFLKRVRAEIEPMIRALEIANNCF